jgi:hypothetical protein
MKDEEVLDCCTVNLTKKRSYKLFFLVLIGILLLLHDVNGNINVYVTNNGTNTELCGITPENACKTISFTIQRCSNLTQGTSNCIIYIAKGIYSTSDNTLLNLPEYTSLVGGNKIYYLSH